MQDDISITTAKRHATETAWIRENRLLERSNRESANRIMRNNAVGARSRLFGFGDSSRNLVSAAWLGEAVVIFTEIGVAPVPLSGTVFGETTHVEEAGAPLQVSATVWLKPASGVSVSE